MPTTRVIIRNVIAYHVGPWHAPINKFTVNVDGQQYSTFDAFVASLCDQAAKQGFEVDVIWRDTRYGREIVKGGARRAEAAA